METQTMGRTLDVIRARTAGLYEQFIHNGDKERADKAALFLRKLHEKEFIVAFCGHFSAGKSTMINELTGEALLPASPIPTSANVVKIKPAKEDFAKIHYHHGRPLLFQAPYEMDHVKRFAKDGEEVSSIEIGHAGSSLPEGVTVMDTPGVDSTDDAHRISTESALHLADMVFYVMDYNHVQSELNFVYTKELQSHGVKLYLIINQVDKHKDEELSFDAFRQSVKESFAMWNVEPEAFYFTSLRNRQLPYNDFDEVKQLIQNSMEKRDMLSEQSAETMMNLLVHEHMTWLAAQQKETMEPLQAITAEAGAHSIEEKEASLRAELTKRDAAYWLKKYEESRDEALKNARLIPASTRELARSFLESTRPDFKVGMLFAKKKTEEERETRLQALVADLTKQTESQLEWLIRQLNASWMKESGLDDPSLAMQAEEMAIIVDSDIVQKAVKPGAGITGDALLNYSEDVASLIKKRAREESDRWKEKASLVLADQFQSEFALIKADYDVWAKRLGAKNELKKLEQVRKEREQQLQSVLTEEDPVLPRSMAALQDKWQAEDGEVMLYDGVDQWTAAAREEVEESAAPELTEANGDVEAAIKRLRLMADRLQHVPGFSRFVEGAVQKASRLENQTYTIALFGAFSAGKSSFANALLGEKVLPVSPNPTTAAVNRIHPVSEEHKHRTANVHLKTADVLLADVNASLGLFHQQAASLEDAYSRIPDVLAANKGEGKEKIHLSFLRAFHAGFREYEKHETTVLTVDLNAFKQFVADEAKSCFVDSIDLYYDCDFTRLGITLVDTPGADSINARHTGVAFEYIKNADAILFVTYYNHAFSKADREFLIQLGRVKDAFELDKMFFIINAIDLAADEQEVQDVKDYVREQLLQYGIRFPRLHGVSSMLAVEEAMAGEWDHPASGMKQFKEPFRSFLANDLAQMAVQSADAEAERGRSQLQKLIASAKESSERGDVMRAELLRKKSEMDTIIQAEGSDIERKRIGQEMDELVHYVKQRVFFRFSDFFKESFNPATLSGQSDSKKALKKSMQELLGSLGYDLAQEMRATSIRIENHGRKLLEDKQQRFEQKAAMIEPELLLSKAEMGKITVPDFESAFQELSADSFSGALSLFKNAKSFFEKNEKQVMMEQLQEQLEPLADEYLTDQKERLLTAAHRFIEQGTAHVKQAAQLDVKEQFEAWLLVLEQHENVEEWELILRDIS